jgi:hypothetical protein
LREKPLPAENREERNPEIHSFGYPRSMFSDNPICRQNSRGLPIGTQSELKQKNDFREVACSGVLSVTLSKIPRVAGIPLIQQEKRQKTDLRIALCSKDRVFSVPDISQAMIVEPGSRPGCKRPKKTIKNKDAWEKPSRRTRPKREDQGFRNQIRPAPRRARRPVAGSRGERCAGVADGRAAETMLVAPAFTWETVE